MSFNGLNSPLASFACSTDSSWTPARSSFMFSGSATAARVSCKEATTGCSGKRICAATKVIASKTAERSFFMNVCFPFFSILLFCCRAANAATPKFNRIFFPLSKTEKSTQMPSDSKACFASIKTPAASRRVLPASNLPAYLLPSFTKVHCWPLTPVSPHCTTSAPSLGELPYTSSNLPLLRLMILK